MNSDIKKRRWHNCCTLKLTKRHFFNGNLLECPSFRRHTCPYRVPYNVSEIARQFLCCWKLQTNFKHLKKSNHTTLISSMLKSETQVISYIMLKSETQAVLSLSFCPRKSCSPMSIFCSTQHTNIGVLECHTCWC